MKINAFLQSLNMGNKVNVLSQNTKEKSVSETLVDDVKTKIPTEVKSILDMYQIKPDSEAAKGIMQFMDQTEGPLHAKLETLEIALYKAIDPTPDNLTQIHQALTSEGDHVDITFDAKSEIKGADAMAVIAQLKLPDAVKATLMRKVSEGLSLKEAIGKVVLEMTPTKQVDGLKPLTEVSLGQLIRVLKRLISEYKGEINTNTNTNININENSNTNIQTKVPDVDLSSMGSLQMHTNNKDLTESSVEPLGSDSPEIIKPTWTPQMAVSPAQAKTESASNPSTVDAELESLEETDLQVILEAVDAVLAQASDLIGALSKDIDIKIYLVETTTASMIEAKQAFETFKLETIKMLEQTTPEKQSANLEKAIETLNQIILKGDVTKYTDMLTEKKLLIMSAELEKAQVLLKQGDFNKALEVVKSAKTLLEGIAYNPSLRRVQLFTQGKLDQLEEVYEKPEKSKAKLEDYIKRQIEPYKEQGMPRNARDVLEVLRFLGLNHEMEVAEGLERKTEEVKKEWAQGNVKEILLKLMKENREEKSVERTGQSLMHLNGQQMMNDSQSGKQPFHFFNMPFMDGEEIGHMKVYMKGHTNNQQIDWKNTEMYFGMQLKKHGPLGIKVKIQDQTIDLQILSDAKIDLKAAFEPVLEALAEQGYHKGEIRIAGYNSDKGIHLKPIAVSASGLNATEPLTQKGFDFKI